MLKKLALNAGILALAVGLYVGCSDASVVGPTDSQTTNSDPYSYLKVDPTEYTDFSEIPSVDDVFGSDFAPVVYGDPGDSTHRDPRDTTHRDPRDTSKHDPIGGGRKDGPLGDRGRGPKGPVRDFGRMLFGSYHHIIAQLNLSAEQDAAVRECFAAYRSCDSAAAADYRTARQAAMVEMHDAMAAIRAAVEDGTMTRDEAKAAIRELQQTYRAAVQSLLSDFNTARQGCRTTFESCVRAQLTDEQAAIWDRLIG
jgi:hypothetical protein